MFSLFYVVGPLLGSHLCYKAPDWFGHVLNWWTTGAISFDDMHHAFYWLYTGHIITTFQCIFT